MAEKIIVVAGPTASGKTRLGIALAQELGGEIVSADSMQIYRRMDIGTAKATAAEQAAVPHHMIDVAEPWENYSVARYVEEASRCCEDIISRGKLPVVVGGTGLYIDSLISGRDFAANDGDEKLREELLAEYDRVGGEEMLRRLREFDPERAAKLPAGDKRRIVRAIEIYKLTGMTITKHDARTRAMPPRYDAAQIILGAAVTVCVATELGAEEQGCADGITVRTGRLDAEGMTALLRGAALCVDATHPYAAEATRNIRAAAAAAGVEYHRLLRPASPLPTGSVVLADAARAAAYLADRPGRVLLATGAKELPAFAALDPARLYPRVLPTLAGIAACEAAGVPHRNILAMQGPFTKELNAALLHQFHIDYMVTKDGGAAGGFAEKAEAAARCGVQLIVLRRPDDEGETTDTILQRCRELL